MDGEETTIDAVIEYCQTQSRLLSGQAQELTEEIDALLDEIDEETTDVRRQLDERQPGGPPGPDPSSSGDRDRSSPAETISELERKQATVTDKQARLDTVNELSDRYLEVAERLDGDDMTVTDGIEAVLRFEAEADAPSYFEDRDTLVETATDQ